MTTYYGLDTYSRERFLHYRLQVLHVLALRPATVLEIGPGDHTVTDILRRRGVEVHTLDHDPKLGSDIVADIRGPLPVEGRYDVVLASEVLEHLDYRWTNTVLESLAGALAPGGSIVLSLPHSTVRLFPPPAAAAWRRHGGALERLGLISAEGRLRTGIPISRIQPLLTVARFLYKLARRAPLREALRQYRMETVSEDRLDVHHWDLGLAPTTRERFRRDVRPRFEIVNEVADGETNCVFFVLRPRAASAIG